MTNSALDVPTFVERPAGRSGAFGRGLSRLDAAATRIELLLLLAIVVAIPLEFTKLWFPVTWIDLSRLGIVCGLAIMAVHALAGSYRFPRTALLAAIVAVVVVDVLSFFAHRWPLGAKEAASTVVYAGFALFVGHVLTRHRAMGLLAATLLGSAVLVAVTSILEEIGGVDLWPTTFVDTLGRRSGTFGDPNIAARFFAMALVVALAILAACSAARRREAVTPAGEAEWTPRRIVPLALATTAGTVAFVAVGDVLTLSRIGWLSALVALAMWIPTALRLRLVAIGIAVFILTFAGYLALAPSASTRASSVAADAITRIGAGDPGDEVTLPDLTLPVDPTARTPFDGAIERLPIDSVRRYLIRAGLAMALDHPGFGVGVGGFDAELRSEYWKYVPIDRRGSPTTLLHTDVMRVIAETGIVGFGAWLTLLVMSAVIVVRGLRSTVTARRLTAWAAGSSLAIIIFASQFAGRFYTEPYLWLVLGVLLALAASTSRVSVTRTASA